MIYGVISVLPESALVSDPPNYNIAVAQMAVPQRLAYIYMMHWSVSCIVFDK